jgi:hypothetical protein
MVWRQGKGFARRVHPEAKDGPDWRDAAAYATLLKADRSILAWEWLRRDAKYRAAAAMSAEGAGRQCAENLAGPENWGLHAFEPPHLTAPDARPVWRADVHPYVLSVRAEGSFGKSDSFELRRLPVPVRVVTVSDALERLLISDGFRTIRVDVLAGSVRSGAVRLHYLLSGFAGAERPLLTLRRLLLLWRTGRFSAALHPLEARARRLVLMLRAHDATASGATQREIAAELLSAEAGEPRWRVGAPTLRSRAQRLVRTARAMAAGGYRSLLRD